MAEEMQAEEMQEEVLDENTQKDRFMTFCTGKECYGISISYVSEIIGVQPITALPEVENYIKGLINLRGKIIPVIDVRIRFGMEPVEYTDRTCIIVISVKGIVIGLIVERIAEVDTIKDEDIVPPPSLGRREYVQNKFVYGVARNADSVKLLIDPERLIKDENIDAALDVQEEEEK